MFYSWRNPVLVLALFCCTGIGTGNGQILSPGRCPRHIKPFPRFNFHRYQGIWYEVEKYAFLPEILGKCVYVRYKNFHPNGVNFYANIFQIQKGTMLKTPTPCKGAFTSKDGSAQINLLVNFVVPFTNMPFSAVNYPYYVVETDYEHYSIKWSCEEYPKNGDYVNFQAIWILTRTPYYPPDLRRHIHERMIYYGLDPTLLELTDQKGCPTPPDDDYLVQPVLIAELPPGVPDFIPVPVKVVKSGNETIMSASGYETRVDAIENETIVSVSRNETTDTSSESS